MANDNHDSHDAPTGLPAGWTWATIGEITENHDSVRVPVKASNREAIQGNYPYYGASGIIDHVNDYLFDGDYLLIAEDGANLLSRSTPIAFRARGKFWVNNHAHIVQTRDDCSLGYLEAYLNSIDLKFFITGTAQPKLTQANLNKIKIPLAPTAEQHRIVAKIEEQFTRLDAGVAALKRAQANLKRYKAAVLKAACEGKLVAQDASDEPASELLKRILAERRAKWEADLRGKGKDPKKAKYEESESLDVENLPALPDKWCWTGLGSLFPVTIGGTPSRQKEEYWNGDIPWVSSGEVRNERIKATREMITTAGRENSNAKLHKPGTVLLAMIGEGKTRGQAAILDIPATTNQNIASILCSETPILPEWVFYWLMSRYEQTRKSGSGGRQYALNSERIRGFAFPLPPLAEQRRIVAEVERRLSVVQELEATLTANLARAERLRQSILKRAFEGKL